MNERPTPQAILIEYVMGDLGPDEAARVERTLARDAEAAAWVAKLRVVIDTLGSLEVASPSRAVLEQAIADFRASSPAPHEPVRWLETVRRLVADLVFDSRAQPALAGFRGGSSGAYQLAFEGDDVRLDVQISPAPEQEGRWRVRGSVHVPPAGTPATAAALVPDAAEEVASSQPIDDRGRFLIETDPGTYDLVIRFEDQALVAPSLELP